MKLTNHQRPLDVVAVCGLFAAAATYYVHELTTWLAVLLVACGYVSAGGPPYFNGRLR